MKTLRTHRWLLALLLVGGLLRLSLAWQSVPDLTLRGNLYDDSFYSLQIARNLATGLGPTFDGVHLTNGFQPLYVFLLVPVFAIAGDDPVLPVHVALTYLSILGTLSAVVLFVLLRRYVGRALALLGAGFWLLSPTIMRHDLNGLETAQAAFFVALSIYWYVARFRGVERPSRRNVILMGVFLGLAVFSRVDALLLLPPLFLDYFVLRRRRGQGRAAARRLAVVGGTAFLLVLPWIVFSLATVNHLNQDSGRASRLVHLAYGSFFGLGDGSEWPDGPSAEFIWDHLVFSLRVFKASPPAYPVFRLLEKVGGSGGGSSGVAVFSDFLALALVVGLVIWAWRNARVGGENGLTELQFSLVYALGLVVAYSAVIFGVVFFTRYYYPIYFLLTLYFIVALDRLGTRLPAVLPALRPWIPTVLGLGLLAASGYMVRNQLFMHRTGFPFYSAVEWIEENTDERDVVGIFQAGTIGYFSNRRVINLDGKVNPEALAYLERNRLAEYVMREGIDYVIDNARVVDLFLGNSAEGASAGLRLELVSGSVGPGGWAAFRVVGGGVTLEGPGSGEASLTSTPSDRH
jgi:hypothetical protein